MKVKIGIGYDIHRLVKGRKLVIGCVEIPYSLGLVGHSDADVLAHAIADSIFGALGLPDIGQQFPDDVSRTKDLNSKIILQHAAYQVEQHGYNISNIDSVIIAQRPKLAEYISAMQLSISDILKINTDVIVIKAKTNEGICTIGHGKAIAAISNCLLIEQM
jgi:2-C-methyl-D-erythritol 2,4-cyclodiphosphate synthase